MKPFRERNPVLVGAVSLAALAAVITASFRVQDLPLIGGGDSYAADFTEAGGLRAGDEVRIAGVRVGTVEAVELDQGHVKATFTITEGDAAFGKSTRASIRVKTLLGSMFLALEPAGAGQLAEGSEIPVDRTTSPYDVVQAFSDLADTADTIDSDQLSAALTTLADLTRTTPDSFKQALAGVSALSENIAAKNDRIGTLLTNLQRVSKVLDDRDEDVVALMKDADTLFDALVQRRQAIHDLLSATQRLSKELSSLIADSRADLKPALDSLSGTLTVLTKNEDNLDASLRLMAPFYRVFASTLGDGPWFDSYIQNMPPVPTVG
ncbi:MCE family protein [Nocardioides sp.]|uniref:MCE family protein n=1 Tax=Nocardioides sp. TaxID=35761 RepID=UPI0039E3E15B